MLVVAGLVVTAVFYFVYPRGKARTPYEWGQFDMDEASKFLGTPEGARLAKTLPPQPPPSVNDTAVDGIDVNHNGVRDDVERLIEVQSKGQPVIVRSSALEYVKIATQIMDSSSDEEASHLIPDLFAASSCFVIARDDYLRAKGESDSSMSTYREARKELNRIKRALFNTDLRKRAALRIDTATSGVIGLGDEENCDKLVTKWAKKSF